MARVKAQDAILYPMLTGLGLMGVVGLWGCGEERVNVLVPDGSPSVALMDFAEPFPLDPLPPGWRHREFLTRAPMDISFATKEGVPAIRLATNDGASMLFRHVDVDLDAYPILSWHWYIEQGIDSAADELTSDGDDHPARLYLVFETAEGETRQMEIIWGNKVLRAGDYKHLKGFFGSFPHYVANGGRDNIGRWHHETVDLREIHRQLWGDPAGVHIVDIALFCDSDETGGRSVAYFADVRVQHAPVDVQGHTSRAG